MLNVCWMLQVLRLESQVKHSLDAKCVLDVAGVATRESSQAISYGS